ncbi:hypothetical protein J6590_033846 [Homalodisca vitripennis]|nr:hypothetical protein J6590_033846 [Homalodisca vitripennis]
MVIEIGLKPCWVSFAAQIDPGNAGSHTLNRDTGRQRQRVPCHLGRLDQLNTTHPPHPQLGCDIIIDCRQTTRLEHKRSE